MEGYSDAKTPEFDTEEALEDFKNCESFEAVDIAYLAVSKDMQKRGIGSVIIEKIVEMALARNENCYFLTVDALNLPHYSAVEFYKRFDFQWMYPPNTDTITMFKTI